MKFSGITFLILSMIANAQASPVEDMAKAVAVVKKFAVEQGSRPLRLSMNAASGVERFDISCPIGLFCPDADYPLLLTANTLQGYLMLSFDKENLQDLSLGSLRETFKYANFALDLSASMKISGFQVSTGIRSMDQNSQTGTWQLNDVGGNALSGSLQENLKELIIQRTDNWAKKNCRMQDMPSPKGCYEYVPVTIPMQVDFAAQLPTQPKDCTKANIDTPECG